MIYESIDLPLWAQLLNWPSKLEFSSVAGIIYLVKSKRDQLDLRLSSKSKEKCFRKDFKHLILFHLCYCQTFIYPRLI